MVTLSVVAGLIGVLGAWYGMILVMRTDAERPPEVFWLLGLAALLPAWIIAFVGLLARLGGRFPPMAVAAWWILSAAAALVGVIVTHARLRGLEESCRIFPPRTYWRLGLGTLLPAWCIAVLGLVLVSLREQ